ncbi:DUF305 domain-containing protein [Microbispora sp. NPDC049125]|uniref:DUF305 domain-containing protein n=1 Tax=Microbispora sp. NPDC049125 TaxID=3154929 RepID=UPI003466D9AE
MTLTGVIAAALLAACGGSGDAAAPSPAASPAPVSTESPQATASPASPAPSVAAAETSPAAETPAAGFNQADVSFARQMIPHHLQAIDLAILAQTRAGDQWIRDLAAQIKDARDPQIRTLKGWLDAWGAEPLPRGHRMPGMLSSADVERLARASGARFDRLFVTMMIEHEGGAITLARAEQAQGAFADATAMAESISTTQTAEVKEMKKYLTALQ